MRKRWKFASTVRVVPPTPQRTQSKPEAHSPDAKRNKNGNTRPRKGRPGFHQSCEAKGLFEGQSVASVAERNNAGDAIHAQDCAPGPLSQSGGCSSDIATSPVSDFIQALQDCLFDTMLANEAVAEWYKRPPDARNFAAYGLSEVEAFAIFCYTWESNHEFSFHVRMGAAMRDGATEPARRAAELMKSTVSNALKKLEPCYVEHAYRGLRVPDCDEHELHQVLIGTKWIDGEVVDFSTYNSFSLHSTTASKFAGESDYWGIMFTVEGGTFRDIGPFSHFPDEAELLEAPPTRYRIIERQDIPDRKLIIIRAIPFHSDDHLLPPSLREPGGTVVTSLQGQVKSHYDRYNSPQFYPLNLIFDDGRDTAYTIDLLKTHRLSYLTRTTGSNGTPSHREASPQKIPDVLDGRRGSSTTFALVEAPAGTGKSTLGLLLAIRQDPIHHKPGITILLRLPDLVGVQSDENLASDDPLRYLVCAAFEKRKELRDKLLDAITRRLCPFHIVLDGYDEVSASDEEIVKSLLTLLHGSHPKSDCMEHVTFTVTSRPLRAGLSFERKKALCFNIRPWELHDAKEYGKHLFTAIEVDDDDRLVPQFTSIVEQLGRDSSSIPLVADFAARLVLSGSITSGKWNSFRIVGKFIDAHLEAQVKRIKNRTGIGSDERLAYFVSQGGILSEIESVHQRCAFACLCGDNVVKSKDESEDLWDAVKQCGLLKATNRHGAFLYKMLCEYFVASHWLHLGGEAEFLLDARFGGATVLFCAEVRDDGCLDRINALLGSLQHGIFEAPKKTVETVPLAVSAAGELSHLPRFVQDCWLRNEREQLFSADGLRKLIVEALAANRLQSTDNVLNVLEIVEATKQDVERCLHLAHDRGNGPFVQAVRDRFGLELKPTAAIMLGLDLTAVEKSLGYVTKELSDSREELLTELSEAASMAVEEQSPKMLASILDALAVVNAKEVCIRVRDGNLLPIANSHPCNNSIRSERRFDVEIRLPHGVKSDKQLDLRQCGRARVLLDIGGADIFTDTFTVFPTVTVTDTQMLIAPESMNGWSWQLSGFQSVETVDLSPLRGSVAVGDWFLYDCPSLQNVDFSPLQDITVIGDGFLYGCTGLHDLDISMMTGLSKIGFAFLKKCTALSCVHFPQARKENQQLKIGAWFMSGCKQLVSVDLNLFANSDEIEVGFLYDCPNLKSIDLTPLAKVRTIGDRFLGRCAQLQAVDLEPLKMATQIGFGFLGKCSSLRFVDLSPLSSVTSIGDWFLFGCSLLIEVDLIALQQVSSFGQNLLGNCTALQVVSVRVSQPVSQPQPIRIGKDFLKGCASLKTIIIPATTPPECEQLLRNIQAPQAELRYRFEKRNGVVHHWPAK